MIREEKAAGVYYRTTSYDAFKRLLGNRSVTPDRVAYITESIKTRGYITSPIIVNEKMEVIDGQGRLEALKGLSMPVEYIVHPGLNIDDCISMNIHMKNWTLHDFMDSYAEQGNGNYILANAVRSEHPNIPLQVVLNVLSGNAVYSDNKKVKNGGLTCTEEQVHESRAVLSFLDEVSKFSKKPNFLRAFAFCFKHPRSDKSRLLDVAEFNTRKVSAPAKTLDVCSEISECYNKRLTLPNRINFRDEYEAFCITSSFGWKSRWESEITGEKALSTPPRERVSGRSADCQ